MEIYVNKVAVVTGASSGIGAGLSKELAKRGCIVIGLARRMDRLMSLSDEIKRHPEAYKGEFYPMQCDITNEEHLEEAFSKIRIDYGVPWILINNAGSVVLKPFLEMDGASFDSVVNTNAKALFLATKLAVKLMTDNGVPGHILNINSILGQYSLISNRNLPYCGSKHMARVLSEGIREMMIHKKLNVKISNISPGLVRTEMTEPVPTLKSSLSTMLSTEEVVKACMCILDTPPNVLIAFAFLIACVVALPEPKTPNSVAEEPVAAPSELLEGQASAREKKQALYPYGYGAYPYSHYSTYPYSGYPYSSYPYNSGYPYSYAYSYYDDGKYYPGKYEKATAYKGYPYSYPGAYPYYPYNYYY
ncbi:hypothetical protein V9T40_012954 [Parthenolecanium corni]|uniref:Farnesol dehydrogenase-like n=1 Tax=Parthenolecanium corni TaxID=536013 RepID=A0AAN9TC21_9HEMI